jgi:hypothetical protein
VAEPALEPERRLADRDVAERPPDEAETALGVVDPDPDRLLAVARRLLPRHGQQLAAEERRHLARDAVDRVQIGAVARRLEIEHLVDERQHLGERRARLERVVEHDDPAVVGAEVELVLGEDHSLRHLPAQLAPLQRQPARQRRARQGDGHLRAGAEVPGAADDRVRAVLSHVDGRELEPVRVRVLLRLEHVTDAEQSQVTVHPDPLDAVHLGGRDRERPDDVGRRCLDADVLAQPADRDPHR